MLFRSLAGYHEKNDKKGAFHQLDGLSRRLALSGVPGMDGERKLVDGLRDRAAYVAGYAGEMPKALRPLAQAFRCLLVIGGATALARWQAGLPLPLFG